LFFKVQRCGPTNPILHKPCHLSDATKRIGDEDSSTVDLTGGWHDAGDYIKFLKTTAYATYMMIFSYEFDKAKFGFDIDHNDVPDILEEAKVGLDWLLRCNFQKDKLASQVQDERDHQVGFRLPENDTLQFDRPAFVSMGKNTIGIYVAALAIAARIWKEKFYDDEFANKCLYAAQDIYSLKDQVPDIDTLYSKVYLEKSFEGKLALGAIELFNTTGKEKYLSDAVKYGEKANSDFWWSYGDINSLAHFRIAQYKPEFSKFIFNNLNKAKLKSDSSSFREGLNYTWGTTNSFLGVALQSILYKKLTGSNEFDSLETFQRDYVLGRNPYGLCFIYNIGSNFPKNLHSQIAYFHNGYLPGALSAGPAPMDIIKLYPIKRTNFSYDDFSTDKIKYYDDYQDFITNEPTIVGNATALFVFGFLSN
jgi:endoglucanase